MTRNTRNVVAYVVLSALSVTVAQAAPSVSLRELQARMTEARMNLAAVEATIEALQDDIAFVEQQIVDLQMLMEVTGSDRYLAPIDAAQAELRDLTGQLQDAMAVAEHWRAEIKRLAAEIAKLRTPSSGKSNRPRAKVALDTDPNVG